MGRMEGIIMERKEISKSVLKRLPGYVTYLRSLPQDSAPYISATALANALGMGEVQVRKDLAMVSDGGRPKIGYLRESLIEDIEQFLGYVFIVIYLFNSYLNESGRSFSYNTTSPAFRRGCKSDMASLKDATADIRSSG